MNTTSRRPMPWPNKSSSGRALTTVPSSIRYAGFPSCRKGETKGAREGPGGAFAGHHGSEDAGGREPARDRSERLVFLEGGRQIDRAADVPLHDDQLRGVDTVRILHGDVEVARCRPDPGDIVCSSERPHDDRARGEVELRGEPCRTQAVPAATAPVSVALEDLKPFVLPERTDSVTS